jgi:hypothetical protein
MAETLLENPAVLLGEVAARLKAGTMVPYLGPGISALQPQQVPLSPEALADFFASKTALPKRAQGNPWAAAQYIESYRFRDTVTLWMRDAFAAVVPPTEFHRWLSGLPLPLIVDTWYAGEMRGALSVRTDWAEVQGITRAGIGEDRWFRFYDAQGLPVDAALAESAATLLYAPHGGAAPDGNFLISDADYVEVLTEIDIQTPIPDEVRRRRTSRSFVFIGCRFHDQLLRTYARQVMKRSTDRHFAVVETDHLSRNERRFLEEQSIVPIDMPLARALGLLMG